MSVLKTIFTRKQVLDHVEETHDLLIGLGARTIEESFLIGSSMNQEKVRRVFEEKDSLVKQLYTENSQWSGFKLFNQIEVQVLVTRSTFVRKLVETEPSLASYLSTPVDRLPSHVLRDISIVGHKYPSVAWSLKLLALYINDVTLIQPNTSPCQRASEFLFGNSFKGDQLGHTILCKEISNETGLSPLAANTALWSIGSRI